MTHDLAPAIAAAPGETSGGRWSLRRIAVISLVLVLAVSLVGGAWWSRHPQVFESAPDTATVGLGENTPVSGGPLHIDMYLQERENSGSVTLADVEPNILVNEADAAITFHMCLPRRTGGIGSVRGALSDWCIKVTDVNGTELPLASGGPRHQLIMTITPRRPGDLVVQGMDLTYRHGLQKGTQRVGEHVWLRFA